MFMELELLEFIFIQSTHNNKYTFWIFQKGLNLEFDAYKRALMNVQVPWTSTGPNKVCVEWEKETGLELDDEAGLLDNPAEMGFWSSTSWSCISWISSRTPSPDSSKNDPFDEIMIGEDIVSGSSGSVKDCEKYF